VGNCNDFFGLTKKNLGHPDSSLGNPKKSLEFSTPIWKQLYTTELAAKETTLRKLQDIHGDLSLRVRRGAQIHKRKKTHDLAFWHLKLDQSELSSISAFPPNLKVSKLFSVGQRYYLAPLPMQISIFYRCVASREAIGRGDVGGKGGGVAQPLFLLALGHFLGRRAHCPPQLNAAISVSQL
jgi:hypothetical protein